jgi:alpha-ketoglutarate-dependent taurine dioxygenase
VASQDFSISREANPSHPITEAQAEALDALHFLADRFSLTLDFQKGDVQYVNNLSIFHARGGFVDAPGQE